jgi:hypothetical protein
MFTLSRTTARLLVIVPLAALLAAACEHNLGGPPAGELLTIVVTPNPGRAVVGGTIQYTAAGQDVTGAVVSLPGPVVWTRLNATAGTINSSTGLFTAGTTAGTYSNTIRATSGGLSGFATAIVSAFVPLVSLGAADPYGILAGSAITCITEGTINADVGISPGSTVTGFPPGGAPPDCVLTGTLNAGDATALAAQTALTATYNTLAGLPCDLVITPADLGGRTLPAGVYCAASSMAVTGTVTLDGGGNPNAEFVFQIGSTLTTATSANIALINGAQARNVWWQVGSSATLGTSTTFRGNIVAFTSITLNDDVTMLGRALARNGAVSLGNRNTITLP